MDLSSMVESRTRIDGISISLSSTFFFSSRRRHTRCETVTGDQTCALPIFLHAATQPGARDDVAPGFQGLDELGNLFRGVRPVRIEHDVEPGSGDVLATPIVNQVVQRLPDAVTLPGAALHVDARAAVPGDLRALDHLM